MSMSGARLTTDSEHTCTQCGLPVPHDTSGDDTFCCYGCRLLFRLTQTSGEEGEAQGLLLRLGIGIFLAMNVMVFSLASYAGYIYDTANDDGVLLFRGVAWLLSTPVVILLGLPFLYSGIKQGRGALLSIDALIGIGVLAAYGLSVYHTLAGDGHVYFETASALLVLLTLGRFLEARSKASAVSEWSILLDGPTSVSVVVDGAVVDRDASSLVPGQVIRLAAGDRLPVDGTIQTGACGFDVSALTGESVPVYREPGDTVYAGTIPVDGQVDVVATTNAEDGAIGRMRKLLERARGEKSRLERLADAVARKFVPGVIGLAAVTFGGWAATAGPEAAVLPTLSVLVVACPCALGIAAPAAVWTALGTAAREGVLVRSSEVLESLGRVDKVFLDKTGTVTTGQPRLSEIVPLANGTSRPDRLLALAEGLEWTTNHPIGRSLIHAAKEQGVTGEDPASVRTYPGLGVTGEIDGLRGVAIGSRRLMEQCGFEMSAIGLAESAERSAQGESLVYLGWDGQVKGMFSLYETLHPEAIDAVSELRSMRLEIELLSGDREESARRMAGRFGEIACSGGLMPEEKVERVRVHDGIAVVVGDGLNDAPAIAAADVGIAVGTGTDLARECAAINILKDDLTLIPKTIRLARRTIRTVKQNFAWAAGYNAIGVVMAAAGMLNPIVAALAMVLSSLFVVWNSRKLAGEW